MAEMTLPVPTALTAAAPEPAPLPCGENRSIRVDVAGGLAGAQRVVTLLQGRRYEVRALTARFNSDAPSTIDCTVELTAEELDLLVRRLHRLPAVLAVGAPDPA